MGPVEKPRRKRLVPRVMTSVLVLNWLAVALMQVLKIALMNVVEKVMPARMAVMDHFRARDQFWGFSGSSGPENLMMLSLWSSWFPLFS